MSTDLMAWGWLLFLSATVAAASFIYRLVWRERYQRPCSDEPLVRVRGVVDAPVGHVVYCTGGDGRVILSSPFTLLTRQGQRWRVDPQGSVLVTGGYHNGEERIRGVIAGEALTVDGVVTDLSRDEVLYRQPGRARGLEAVRMAGGTWPELRWLRLPRALAAIVFLISLSQVLLAPPSRTPLAERMAKTLPGVVLPQPVAVSDDVPRWLLDARTVLTASEPQWSGRLIGDRSDTSALLIDDCLVYHP